MTRSLVTATPRPSRWPGRRPFRRLGATYSPRSRKHRRGRSQETPARRETRPGRRRTRCLCRSAEARERWSSSRRVGCRALASVACPEITTSVGEWSVSKCVERGAASGDQPATIVVVSGRADAASAAVRRPTAKMAHVPTATHAATGRTQSRSAASRCCVGEDQESPRRRSRAQSSRPVR